MCPQDPWSLPKKIKIYGGLGCAADGRVRVHGNRAMVTSSNGKKEYVVVYAPKRKAIVSNDNGSYWRGYLGYPAVAYLMKKKIIPYNRLVAHALSDIPWKALNTKYKNDYRKTLVAVKAIVRSRGLSPTELSRAIESSFSVLRTTRFAKLPFSKSPPKGF